MYDKKLMGKNINVLMHSTYGHILQIKCLFFNTNFLMSVAYSFVCLLPHMCDKKMHNSFKALSSFSFSPFYLFISFCHLTIKTNTKASLIVLFLI